MSLTLRAVLQIRDPVSFMSDSSRVLELMLARQPRVSGAQDVGWVVCSYIRMPSRLWYATALVHISSSITTEVK